MLLLIRADGEDPGLGLRSTGSTGSFSRSLGGREAMSDILSVDCTMIHKRKQLTVFYWKQSVDTC